jgi:hypothetical protein
MGDSISQSIWQGFNMAHTVAQEKRMEEAAKLQQALQAMQIRALLEKQAQDAAAYPMQQEGSLLDLAKKRIELQRLQNPTKQDYTMGNTRFSGENNQPIAQVPEKTSAPETLEKQIDADLLAQVRAGTLSLMDAAKKKQEMLSKNETGHNVTDITSPDGKTAQKMQYNPQTKRYDIPVGTPYPVQSKATNVTTNVNVGPKSMEKLGEEMSKSLVDERKDVMGSVKALDNVKEAEKLLNAGMITGTGADYLVNLGNFLSSRLGVKLAEDPVKNSQAYAATMGNQVGQIIKQFGSGTGLSDADREYAEKIVGGKITLNEKAIRKLLEINKKAYRNVIENFNARADQAMKKPGAEALPYDLRIKYNFDDKAQDETKPARKYRILQVK